MGSIAIMLNTCDKFQDLWPLFFDCLYRFWNPKYRVYLNTETLDYTDERFDIVPIHPQKGAPWSDRLFNCVDSIEEDYVLCIEDECLIEETVNVKEFEHAVTILDTEPDAACVWLVHIIPGLVKDDDSYLPFRERKDYYKTAVVQQVCLWNRKKWLKYIKPNENPWEYEFYSSARGYYGNDRFFVLDEKEEEVIKYGYGFIVYRGYWCREEKERLENKLGLVFDETVRKTETKEKIDQITKSSIISRVFARFKRMGILVSRFVFHRYYIKKSFKDKEW